MGFQVMGGSSNGGVFFSFRVLENKIKSLVQYVVFIGVSSYGGGDRGGICFFVSVCFENTKILNYIVYYVRNFLGFPV